TSYTITIKPISATTQQHYLSAFLSYDRQLKEAGQDLIEQSAQVALAHEVSAGEPLDEFDTNTIPDAQRAELLKQQGQASNQAEGDVEQEDGLIAPGLNDTVAIPVQTTGDAVEPLDATVGVDLAAIANDPNDPNDPNGPPTTPSEADSPISPDELVDSGSDNFESDNFDDPAFDDAADATPMDTDDPDDFAQEFEAALAAEDVPQSRFSLEQAANSTLLSSPSIITSHSVSLPPSKPSPPILALDQAADLENLPPEEMGNLPPRALTQALLQRSIVQGIGRLFLERHQDHGRILCSQDGVLEAVLDPIALPNFQGVINELKLLAEVPLLQVERAKQVDVERMHDEELLLFRLRLTPGIHGEEATLQVLRGAALKFYQQQQLSKLGQNALTLARRLQHQVAEIEARSRLLPGAGAESFPSVPELRQLIRYIATTLDHLYYP
ncbi:MAG: hypothetical protein AAGF75_02390, partial [Cyanobacteria bacterium P01_H01_bin.130]